jgi:transcription elongation factor
MQAQDGRVITANVTRDGEGISYREENLIREGNIQPCRLCRCFGVSAIGVLIRK